MALINARGQNHGRPRLPGPRARCHLASSFFALPLVEAGQGSAPCVREIFVSPGVGPFHALAVCQVAESGCPNEHLLGGVWRQSAKRIHQAFLTFAERGHSTIMLRVGMLQKAVLRFTIGKQL